MKYHFLAFIVGFVLDLLIGDPHSFPHPIRLIGKLIAVLDKKWNNGTRQHRLLMGRWLVVTVTGSAVLATAILIFGFYLIHPIAGVVVEAILTYYILATRSLRDESMKVCKALERGDVEGARYAVSMIVGRDTSVLDDIGIAKAAIETVAENASDGVIAPLLFTAVGGPILGFFYKAVNTMDSMVGYKNKKYLDFGRTAALLDDVVNFVPSRVSAWLMIIGCLFLGKDFSAKDAARIHRRDCHKHASPNSAQTESTCAGALGIQLAGDAVYFGEVHKKPFIGDSKRPVEYEDIRRANNLMYAAAILAEVICAGIMCIIAFA